MKRLLLSAIAIALAPHFIIAQNVGIGTATPSEKLHVVGGARITSLGGSGNSLVLSDNNGVLSSTALSGNATDVFTGAGTFVPGTSFGDNLGNHTATTNLQMSTFEIDNVSFVDVTAGVGNGIRFWQSDSYAINMGNTAEFQYGSVTDYSIKMNMNNQANRGWTWGVDGLVPIAALSTQGHMNLAGNMTIASLGGSGNTLIQADNNGLLSKKVYSGTATDVLTGDGNWTPITSLSDNDWTVSGTTMYNNNTGNIGIGTTTPSAKLEIAGWIGRTAHNNGALVGSYNNVAPNSSFTNPIYSIGSNYLPAASTLGNMYGIGYTHTNASFITDPGPDTWGMYVAANGAAPIWLGANVGGVSYFNAGSVGFGTTTPAARIQVVNGSIMPHTGNNSASGIYFPTNPGGGGGDEAFIRHYIEAGENTKLVIANLNDSDDDISLNTGLGNSERINIDGNGQVRINRGVLLDCNDCGHTGTINLGDGGGADWGDLTIQGRVLSTNSNLHLSPPGGNRVIINSSYRAAGGATGTTGLDIQDGGIRMRKNYRYYQRYRYCNCYGAGAGTYDIGAWDFCAVSHVGFKNNQSNTDEDDDVQCAVYPIGFGGSGEQTNYTADFTYQYNSRPSWRMYLEAYQDTNGVTCGASCINFD